jgi:acetylornithine deacetylase/succinyl-diaminopimelate desuccinylase-like protein
VLREQGAQRFIYENVTDVEKLRRNIYRTTANINGIHTGYTGEGSKTVMPRVATAKVDIRLVPGQVPDAVQDGIRKHLDAYGYTDIEITRLHGYPAAQTAPSEPAVQALLNSIRKHAPGAVEVWPRYSGAAPHYLFTEVLNLPSAFGGLGHGGRSHAPNEYITIEGFKRHEYGIAEFLLRFGGIQ